MVCIYCGSSTQVINSRSQKRSNQVWRRRKCVGCKQIFTTEEKVNYENVWLVKDKVGMYKPFSAEKLRMSLYNCFNHRKTALEDALALTETVTQRLQGRFIDGQIDSKAIYHVSVVALSRFDKAAGIIYSANHKG